MNTTTDSSAETELRGVVAAWLKWIATPNDALARQNLVRAMAAAMGSLELAPQWLVRIDQICSGTAGRDVGGQSDEWDSWSDLDPADMPRF